MSYKDSLPYFLLELIVIVSLLDTPFILNRSSYAFLRVNFCPFFYSQQETPITVLLFLYYVLQATIQSKFLTSLKIQSPLFFYNLHQEKGIKQQYSLIFKLNLLSLFKKQGNYRFFNIYELQLNFTFKSLCGQLNNQIQNGNFNC